MGSKPSKLERATEILKRSFLMGNFVKAFFFFLIGALLVVGNYVLEAGFVSVVEPLEEIGLVLDYEEENHIPDRGLIRFADESVSGISNSVTVSDVSPDGDEYIMNLDSAKLWGNFEISNVKINLIADKVVIIPDRAVFDLEFDGKRVVLSVFDGDVYVGILEEGVSVTGYVDGYSEIFGNRLLVPRDTQVNISLNKLDERIKSLLYSKLVKEFKYSAVPSSVKESDWVSGNLQKDEKYIESVKQGVISNIIFTGASVSETLMGDFVFWAEENLTFIPGKKREVVFGHLFAYLDDAIFYANEGDDVKSELSLEEFGDFLTSLPSDISESDEFYERFDQYIDVLSIFGPNDPLYPILVELLNQKFVEGRDVYEVVNMLWLNVYDGISIGDFVAEGALDLYYGYFDSTLGEYDDYEFYKNYITYNNQLFDNLLLRYSSFYKDGYFAIKNVLEQELLKIYEAGQLKDELAQAFISNKIRFLKRMMSFFFEEEISVIEAKGILSRLVEEIDELMPVDDSGVAVIELFEVQLEDVGDFWGYLNSSEYHISKTYGSNHYERYESYLTDKDRIWSVIDVQEDILGETVSEITIGDVERELLSLFTENPDISDLSLVDLEDVNQRNVKVQGVIGGYPFEAVYDRDQDYLTDVYAYGEIVSDRALHLENLLDLLKENFAEFVGEAGVQEEELTEETIAQRRARLFIVEIVGAAGFVIEMEDVSVIDTFNSVYRIEEVYISDHEDVIVTFDYMMLREERATNIYLSVDGKPVVLEGEFALVELKDIIVAEEDFSPEEDDVPGVGVTR